jgi:membrane peptidoglycan carboxypeptidase
MRPLDLTAFYAAIANEGQRPLPHSVDSIDRDGQTIYRYQQTASSTITSVDPAAFYQLKSMMQGVLARGTARAISRLAPYVAGKTGTSDEENDAWFVGFTNDVTVASGWATTTPAASAAPSAAARPAAASPFRSSNRLSRRYGPMPRQKPRLLFPRPRPAASFPASQLTSNPGR